MGNGVLFLEAGAAVAPPQTLQAVLGRAQELDVTSVSQSTVMFVEAAIRSMR